MVAEIFTKLHFGRVSVCVCVCPATRFSVFHEFLQQNASEYQVTKCTEGLVSCCFRNVKGLNVLMSSTGKCLQSLTVCVILGLLHRNLISNSNISYKVQNPVPNACLR